MSGTSNAGPAHHSVRLAFNQPVPIVQTSVAANGFDQNRADLVRVHVRGRTAILEVALAVLYGVHRDTRRSAAVELSKAERVDRRGLVQSGESLFVVRAVDLDVVVVAALQLLHRL